MPRLSVYFVRASLIYLVLGFTFGGLLLANKGVMISPFHLGASPCSHRIHLHRLDDTTGDRHRLLDFAAFFKKSSARRRTLELGHIDPAQRGHPLYRFAKPVRSAMVFFYRTDSRSPCIDRICHRQLEAGQTVQRVMIFM